MKLARELEDLSADLLPALEELPLISILLDFHRRVRWQSETALRALGDLRGRLPDEIIVPEDLTRSREEFAQKLLGLKRTSDYEANIVLADGTVQPVEINSVALGDAGHVVGIFGILHELGRPRLAARRADATLTPRQHEVLVLLAAGRSTRQIAGELHLSVETVRNHVRGILRALGTSSRLEALAVARRDHLI